MRQSTAGQKTGIQCMWTFTRQQEDLDLADDISLLSHGQQDAQEKLGRVAAEAEKTGLGINTGKTEPTYQQQRARPSQTMARRDQGSGQVHLPGQCSEQGRCSRRRHQEPHQQSQTHLQNPHKRSSTVVVVVVVVAQKSTQMKNFGQGRNKPQLKKTLRRGNGGGLATRCANLHQPSPDRHWTGTPKVDRPRQTWRRSTDAEVKAPGMTWVELKRISQNRVRWRSAVAALCSRVELEA